MFFMEPRTFRQASCFAVVGGLIAMAGAVIAGIAAYHLATGIPLMQATSKFQGGVHVASSSELWFGIVGGIPFFLLGTVILLNAFNSAITIDPQGIVATNLIKRPFFQATWSDISVVRRINSGPGSGYEVIANGKTLRIQTSTEHMKELVAAIQKETSHCIAGTSVDNPTS
ncbi:MAG: hypothetical protein JWN14_3660 [Chthonomonadales bacterium]|nr:hypothetical protein [Chthonomonadales bacterium]